MVGEETHDVNNEFVILVFPVTTYLSPTPLANGYNENFLHECNWSFYSEITGLLVHRIYIVFFCVTA